MAGEDGLRVLTINSGSSSLKFSLYQMGQAEVLVLSGRLERIGLRGGLFHIHDAGGATLIEEHAEFPDHDAALTTLLKWLESRFPGQALDGVGHRVVHGGTKYSQPHLVAPDLLAALDEIVRLAPEHMPHELAAIRAVERHYPGLRQVACFDTAFHRQMPEVAQRFPLPRSLWYEGVLRYGFHGLSYEYIMEGLREAAGTEAARGRVIIAHLGNGASMAAVLAGKGIDTTMGLTPAGGLMMGTRSGDLDPGLLLYLLRGKGTQPVHRGLPGEPAFGLDRRVGQQLRHARSPGPRGKRSPRRPGSRAVLLSGAEAPGGAGRRLGRTGHPCLHRRRRRQRPARPATHLPGIGVHGHSLGFPAQRSQRAGDQH